MWYMCDTEAEVRCFLYWNDILFFHWPLDNRRTEEQETEWLGTVNIGYIWNSTPSPDWTWSTGCHFRRRHGTAGIYSPRYLTVLRGTGFQLRHNDFSQPIRRTNSRTLASPMAPMGPAQSQQGRWFAGGRMSDRGDRQCGPSLWQPDKEG